MSHSGVKEPDYTDNAMITFRDPTRWSSKSSGANTEPVYPRSADATAPANTCDGVTVRLSRSFVERARTFFVR